MVTDRILHTEDDQIKITNYGDVVNVESVSKNISFTLTPNEIRELAMLLLQSIGE